MNFINNIQNVYISVEPCDLRKGIDGYASLVRSEFHLNQWNALIYYLQDGRIPATNNIAEREGIKPFVMARKNFLFADTRRGAEISSIWFSLIISARMNKLNIEKYLTYVLDELIAVEEITDEIIDMCLPYSTGIPSNIKL